MAHRSGPVERRQSKERSAHSPMRMPVRRSSRKTFAPEIVAAQELLFEELILLCGERSWQRVRCAWYILAAQQMSEFGNLAGPRQLVEDRAESEETADAGGGRQRRSLRPQARHPSQDVGIATELLDASELRVLGAQINQEVTHHDVVVACAGRSECGAQRLDGAGQGGSQRMLEWRATPALHGWILG